MHEAVLDLSCLDRGLGALKLVGFDKKWHNSNQILLLLFWGVQSLLRLLLASTRVWRRRTGAF